MKNFPDDLFVNENLVAETDSPEMIFQKADGNWYFLNERYEEEGGPFDDQALAQQAAQSYFYSVLEDIMKSVVEK
jgi:hypothetical protein